MPWEQVNRVYFLGIGGIGMSALATFFLKEGKNVSGYDRTPSGITRRLEQMGASIHYEMDAAHLEGQELVIYTPAIASATEEFRAAAERGIPILKRAQALGEISRDYRTLAVAGTHGKTTTSAMLTQVLRGSGVDSTAFLGGISENLGSNFVHGASEFLVAEADEYDRSFLTLHPEWAIISSMDPDHLDIYGSAGEMKEGYLAFASQAGQLLVHHSLAKENWSVPFQTYGLGKGDFRAKNLSYHEGRMRFDWSGPGVNVEGLELMMPGGHNASNMTAALGLAFLAGADPGRFREAVAEFRGIARRFQLRVQGEELAYVDDYAHHPGEIAAVLETARAMYPGWKLVLVFQPHLFTRTRDQAEGFAEVLDRADVVRLMEIYPAREAPIEGVDSEMILRRMELEDKGMVSREGLIAELEKVVTGKTVLMTLGAGDIDLEVEKIEKFMLLMEH